MTYSMALTTAECSAAADPLNLLLGGEEEKAAGKKTRGKRRDKDPSAPKKPSSAMNIYVETKKPAIKQAEPNLPVMEINRRLQREWQDLPVKERAEWSKKAADDKARYDAEMRAYEHPTDSLLKPTKSGSRLQKDPRRPKKPKTAYLYFADRHRATLARENPGAGRGLSLARAAHGALSRALARAISKPAPRAAGVSLLSKKIAELWKEATDEERAEFTEMAETDKARFDVRGAWRLACAATTPVARPERAAAAAEDEVCARGVAPGGAGWRRVTRCSAVHAGRDEGVRAVRCVQAGKGGVQDNAQVRHQGGDNPGGYAAAGGPRRRVGGPADGELREPEQAAACRARGAGRQD